MTNATCDINGPYTDDTGECYAELSCTCPHGVATVSLDLDELEHLAETALDIAREAAESKSEEQAREERLLRGEIERSML